MKASNSKHIELSLPEDIALKIVSSLPVLDVCSLGSCSRFWRKLCGSDSVWEFLCKDRWPALKDSSAPEIKAHELHPQGWKGLYISKHSEMAARSTVVVNFVKQYSPTESIEVGHYLAAIEILWSMQFGFKDVQMSLLKPNLDVLLNLVGLHYCISWLGVPAESITEALNSCKIGGRKVRVQWWKLGRWSHGFRLQDETHSRNISLKDLAMANEEEVLEVLRRGAVYEGWKGLYISKHGEMAARSTTVVNFVKEYSSNESIEVGRYLDAIEILSSMQFGFKDVQMFLLKPNLDVLLNLVGLQYCISWLTVPAESITEALNSCKIGGRKVRVLWWRVGPWHGFRLQDETHSPNISLKYLAMAIEEEVLGVPLKSI